MSLTGKSMQIKMSVYLFTDMRSCSRSGECNSWTNEELPMAAPLSVERFSFDRFRTCLLNEATKHFLLMTIFEGTVISSSSGYSICDVVSVLMCSVHFSV